MLSCKTFKHNLTSTSIWLTVVLILLIFQIRHGSTARMTSLSTAYNYTKGQTQYIQFAQPQIPSFPKGNGFAQGSIDLGGGLKVYQAKYFTKIWAINQGGYDNLGLSFYEPSLFPKEYYLLGHFSQSNAKPIFASVLVAQDTTSGPNNSALAKPIGYTLVWSSVGVGIIKDGDCYIWLPIPPNGYKSVGQIVTKTPNTPSTDTVRVVREDLTTSLEVDQWVWGESEFNILTTRPSDRGVNSHAVPVGTFMATNGRLPLPANLACLTRGEPDKYYMPNIPQVRAMIEAYSPVIYFHPREEYLPSTVEWYFQNGASLYRAGQSGATPIRPHGWNLPIRGSVDDYNMDLPNDQIARENTKRGDLRSSKAYIHVKSAFGATYTDLAIWLFYPFNGPGHVRIGPFKIKFKRVGEHIGDWEHLTLRVDNFNGGLKSIYLSQHNKGTWLNAMEFEYEHNKPVVYSALHGHALYSSGGEFIHGKDQELIEPDATWNVSYRAKDLKVGVTDVTGKGNNVMDIRLQYEILESDPNTLLREQWLFYPGRWGPKFTYKIKDEIHDATSWLPGKLKKIVRKLLNELPAEVLGEEGPQGPMMKDSWTGDERS